MKTVNQITREAGITRQTLYNALKRAGTTVNALATEKRGNTMLFDAEAEKKLVNIIQSNCKTGVNATDELSKANTKLKQQAEDIKRLQAEAEGLRRELEETQRRAEDVNRLQSELDALRDEHKALIGTTATQAVTIQQQAETIHQLQQRQQARITDGGDGSKPGWIRRTLQRITGRGRKE